MYRIEPFGGQHDRAAFSCGVPALDQYLKTQASQDFRKRAAAVFVMTPDGRKVAGYYTLSQFAVELEGVPAEFARRLPRYPIVPATLLGRLAVSSDHRGQRIGETLLMDALHRALRGSREIASDAVVVDAKDANAESFYARYGFIRFQTLTGRLFLPMGSIEKLFSP